MKQDKDKESQQESHRYQSISRNSHNTNSNNLSSNEEIIDETKVAEMMQSGIVKRKLFFSAGKYITLVFWRPVKQRYCFQSFLSPIL